MHRGDDGQAIDRLGIGTDAGFDVLAVSQEEGAVVVFPGMEEGKLVARLLEREVFDAEGKFAGAGQGWMRLLRGERPGEIAIDFVGRRHGSLHGRDAEQGECDSQPRTILFMVSCIHGLGRKVKARG